MINQDGHPSRSARRQLTIAVLACVIGTGLLFLAASRSWADVTFLRDRPLGAFHLHASGHNIEPGGTALTLLGLAGVVGLLATRRWGRLAVGAVLAAVGLVVAMRCWSHVGALSPSQARDLLISDFPDQPSVGITASTQVRSNVHIVWPLLAGLGGLFFVTAGGMAIFLGRHWPGMSSRYTRSASTDALPAKSSASQDVRTGTSAWDAIDRGVDPTEE